MDKYFKQFDDERIEQLFCVQKNIPILEEIINKDIRVYSKLKDLPLNYGKIPKRSHLPLLLAEIKPMVDVFFGAPKIKAPTVDYKRILERGLQFSDFSDFLMFFSIGV